VILNQAGNTGTDDTYLVLSFAAPLTNNGGVVVVSPGVVAAAGSTGTPSVEGSSSAANPGRAVVSGAITTKSFTPEFNVWVTDPYRFVELFDLLLVCPGATESYATTGPYADSVSADLGCGGTPLGVSNAEIFASQIPPAGEYTEYSLSLNAASLSTDATVLSSASLNVGTLTFDSEVRYTISGSCTVSAPSYGARVIIDSQPDTYCVDGALSATGVLPVGNYDIYLETIGQNNATANTIDAELVFVKSSTVAINIKPGDPSNFIDTDLPPTNKVHVAVLTEPGFDALTDMDISSVAFGPGAAHAVGTGYISDPDGDGDNDLVLKFRLGDTGIGCEEPYSPELTSDLLAGGSISGSDFIYTPACSSGCHP
jgi:hypothetical protein